MANGLFGGGNGTTTAPYLVEDWKDIVAINKNISAHYKQVSDIDAIDSALGWSGIGTSSMAFTGSYEGQGYKISNLTRNITETDVTSNVSYTRTSCLFNFIDAPSIIQNVHLENVSYTAKLNETRGYGTHWHLGLVVGSGGAGTRVHNCSVKGARVYCSNNGSSSVFFYSGGIVGNIDCESSSQKYPLIKSCVVEDYEIEVSSTRQSGYGGFVWCYLTGISGDVDHVGVGSIVDCHVKNFTTINTGSTFDASAHGMTSGGSVVLIDCSVSDSMIKSRGKVTGMSSGGTLRRCHVYNTTMISENEYVGGLTSGYLHVLAENCSVTDCIVTAKKFPASGAVTYTDNDYVQSVTGCVVKNTVVTGTASSGMIYGPGGIADSACIDVTVIATNGWAGGMLVDSTYKSSYVVRSLFSGTVQGNFTHLAGIAIMQSTSAYVANSFFLGEYIKGLGGKTTSYGRITSIAFTNNSNNYALDSSQIILE